MVKEIGSDFPISLSLFSKKRKNLPKNSILLTSGRDCLAYILKSLKPTSDVLLPSYLCPSVLEPFKKLNIKYKFYKVNKNLNIDLTDLKRKIKSKKPTAVLTINYFGFIQPEINKIKEVCNENKIILIEDQVQSFLTKNTPKGDIIFNSYRKFLPLPDGAFLKGNLKRVKTYPNKTKFSSMRLKAGIMKNLNFPKEYYYERFKSAEDKLDTHPWPSKMSKTSKKILNKLNLREIVLKRRKNYIFLLKNLKSKNIKPLYSNLPKEVCPLGFPIISKKRDEDKSKLVESKIYPPVHWILPEKLDKNKFKDSLEISNQILTIPIDQRYNLKDMKRVINILNKFNLT